MTTVNALSEIAALMGDPARASMLSLLMDGRAHTASDLAHNAGITAQTASGHLSRMVEAEPAGGPRPGPQPLLSPRFARGGARDQIADGAGRHAGDAGIEKRGVAARSRSPLLPHLLRPSRWPGRHCRHRFADPAETARTQGAARLAAHAIGRTVLRPARRRSRHGAPGKLTPLRAPVPRLERTPAAHLGRARRRCHRRHFLQARLGQTATPQSYRAPDGFRPPLGNHFGATVLALHQPWKRGHGVASPAALTAT